MFYGILDVVIIWQMIKTLMNISRQGLLAASKNNGGE